MFLLQIFCVWDFIRGILGYVSSLKGDGIVSGLWTKIRGRNGGWVHKYMNCEKSTRWRYILHLIIACLMEFCKQWKEKNSQYQVWRCTRAHYAISFNSGKRFGLVSPDENDDLLVKSIHFSILIPCKFIQLKCFFLFLFSKCHLH